MKPMRLSGAPRPLVALLAVVAVVVGALGLVAPAGAAERLATTTLETGRVGGLVVDPASGRVLVARHDLVEVLGADGTHLGAIEGIAGATEVTVAQDGVWVLGADEMVRVDPMSLVATARWPLTGVDGAFGLAEAGGRLWTSGSVGGARAVVEVVPTSGALVVHPAPAGSSDLVLAGSPQAPDVLLGGTRVGPYPAVYSFDVSNGGFSLSAIEATDEGRLVNDISISPDGATALVASAVPTPDWSMTYSASVLALTLPDLTRTESPAANSWVMALDQVSVGGEPLIAYGAVNLRMFGIWPTQRTAGVVRRGNRTTTLFEAALLGPSSLPVARGTALAADGSRLYLLESAGGSSAANVRVVDLAPQLTEVSPALVGTRGGAAMAFVGTGLVGAELSVGGVAPATSSYAYLAPPLPAGTAGVSVSRFGLAGESDITVEVRNLGPFRQAHDYTWYVYQGIGRFNARAEDVARVEAALIGGGSLGDLPVEVARINTYDSVLHDQIIRLYQAILLRPPDTAGLDYWVSELSRGKSLASIANDMAASAEFRNRYGRLTNRQFVDQIYRHVLDRPAEPGGLAYWVGVLESGRSRGAMVAAFAQSPENVSRMRPQAVMTRIYYGLLGRTPKRFELLAALAMDMPEDAAAQIVMSAEFAARVG